MEILVKEKYGNCDYSGAIGVQRFAFLFSVYFYKCKENKKNQ